MSSSNLDFVKTVSRYLNYSTVSHQCKMRNILHDFVIEAIEMEFTDDNNKLQALLYEIIRLKRGKALSDILFDIIDNLLHVIKDIPL